MRSACVKNVRIHPHIPSTCAYTRLHASGRLYTLILLYTYLRRVHTLTPRNVVGRCYQCLPARLGCCRVGGANPRRKTNQSQSRRGAARDFRRSLPASFTRPLFLQIFPTIPLLPRHFRRRRP